MLIPAHHLKTFLQFIRNIGGSVSGPKPTAPEYVIMLGGELISLHAQNTVYQVTSTNPQTLSTLQPQWVSVVQALARPAPTPPKDESDDKID